MIIYESPQAFRAEHSQATVVTIGMFDGVHCGHREILARTVALAQQHNQLSVVYTFTPHPHYVMRGRTEPFLLTSDPERLKLLEETGIDILIIQKFDKKFAALPPDHFVQEILIKILQVKTVVIGFSHVFGAGGHGTPHYLKEQGKEYGFATEEVEPYTMHGEKISSTVIRHCIRNGNLECPHELMGRSYNIKGTVAHGDGQGHSLGAPTANITPLIPEKLVPQDGIYLGSVQHHEKSYNALIYCGYRPTYTKERTDSRIEAHLLNFKSNLYGATVTAFFYKKLRNDCKFATSSELADQIQKDITTANTFFKEHKIS